MSCCLSRTWIDIVPRSYAAAILQTSLRSLMSRLIQNEEKGVSTARMEESVGLMSQWPSLLLEDLEETFAATTRDGLQASSKEQILLATIEILPGL